MKFVKTNHSIVTFILLSIITLGIYGLYYIYILADDVNTMCADDGKKTAGLFMYILLSIVTCGIYSIVWWYGVCERVGRAAARRNIQQAEISGNTFLLWFLLSLFVCNLIVYVAYHKLFEACNAVGAEYNSCVQSGVNPFAAVNNFDAPPINDDFWQ